MYVENIKYIYTRYIKKIYIYNIYKVYIRYKCMNIKNIKQQWFIEYKDGKKTKIKENIKIKDAHKFFSCFIWSFVPNTQT